MPWSSFFPVNTSPCIDSSSKKKKKILPSLFWALDLSARGISQHSLTLGVIKYLNRNRQKWWGSWSLSEINGSYECKVSNCNQKNVEGKKKRLKVDLQKVGIKQNLKKIQRIQGDWRKENWVRIRLCSMDVSRKSERVMEQRNKGKWELVLVCIFLWWWESGLAAKYTRLIGLKI